MSVAKPLPHESARLHVTGTARYTDDIPAPVGCLHLAFGVSEIACGTLDALDLDAVRAAPGVVAVLSAEDLNPMPDCSPSLHDEPLLCTGAIHYAGQPLYLVVAESHRAARRAARLHEASVTERPPILTVEDALAAGAWFDHGPRIWTDGDVEAGLAAAPHRLDGVIEIGGQEHFYLEGQAALAVPSEAGEMHVHSSTQHPTEIQHKIADALGVPMHAVRSEVRRMGGGFGGKESQGNALAIACAVAARLTGKACGMRYDRDDDFVVTGKRHDFRVAYEVGHDAEGRVLAVRFRHWTRCGWAQDLSLPVADRAMLHADNAYDIPAMAIESWRLRTNTQSATAFRGFGGPQGMLGIERVMDHVAHAVGRDPLAVRRLNFYADAPAGGGGEGPAPRAPRDISGERKNEAAKTGRTHYGQEVTDFCLNGLVDALADRSDYAGRRAKVAEWNAANPVLKRGIALTPVKFGISFTLTHLNQAGALVHVYADGSIHLNHGGTEMGQGLHSKVAQVAADRFGCDLARVKVTATDTGKVPNTSATAASSGADLNGMAVKAACDTIRDRMAEALAAEHQAKPGDVVFAERSRARRGRGIRVRGGRGEGLCRARPAFGDRVLRNARDHLGPRGGTGAAVLLLRLWRGLLGGGDRHAHGREPHPAHRHSPRRGRLAEPSARYRASGGWLRAGRGLADHRGARLGRSGPAPHPCARDLQDPLRLRPAADLRRGALGGGEPRGDDLSVQGGRGAAFHARDQRLPRALGCHRRLRCGLSRARRAGHGGAGARHRRSLAMTLDIDALRRALAGGPVARVLVVEARGSVPRGAGTSMLVRADGSEGTIGGGALEWRALEVARGVLADGRPHVERMPLGPALGQCCGGSVTLVVERLEAVPDTPWLRRVTGTTDAPVLEGFAFSDGWVREEASMPARDVWLWGAGHVGAALARVLAPLPDLAVTIVDDAEARIPAMPDGVTRLVAADMSRAMAHAPSHAEHLIATYGHDIDLSLCHAALLRGFGSCGLIGSATKWARFEARLAALGHAPEAIDRIACPIGDPSMGKHPQAIAVGVAATLLSREPSDAAAEGASA